MKLTKLFLIPRAIADAGKVLLKRGISFEEKVSIAKTLLQLKLLVFTKPTNSIIHFNLIGKKIGAYNNTALQFLVKEIFIERVYSIKQQKALKILDAGANIGLAVLYFSRVFPQAKLEAYEPDAESFALLKENTKGYPVELHPKAVADHNGYLYAQPGSPFASVNSRFSKVESPEKIPAVRLADLLTEPYDIIKLDIEGGEWDILKDVIGENKLLQCSNWLIEFHEVEQNVANLTEIKQRFLENGFKMEQRGDVIYFRRMNG